MPADEARCSEGESAVTRREQRFSTLNTDFHAYDQALTELIDLNQSAFDAAISDGESDLGGWDGWIPYGAAGLIVILVGVGVGVWPRLAEYR